MEIIVRSARIRLGMASRTGGKMAKKEEKIDLILGELRNGYHHLINKDFMGALLSSSDLRRFAQREDIAVHILEIFGPVSYNVGTVPLRRLEAMMWSKFHQMASDLTSWVVKEAKALNLDFIHHSCDRMFKAKHMLSGNIPFDYVAGGRMSEENIAKVVRAVERSFPKAKIIPRSLEPLRGNKRYYLSPRDFGVSGARGGRISVVVEIEEKLVGIGVRNGVQIFNRVRVDTGTGEGG
jgi:hypothetical protein